MNNLKIPYKIHAGPVLKAVASPNVIIWIATTPDISFTIKFSIRRWDKAKKQWNFDKVVSEIIHQTNVSISKDILITTVEYKLVNDGNATGTDGVLSYTAISDDELFGVVLLKRFEKLSDYGDRWISITSSNGLIKNKARKKIILALSCRKMSAERSDAVSGLISCIRRNYLDNDINALCLLGDQIYADETGDFLKLITELATRTFVGYSPTKNRRKIANKIGLTTGYPEQQLLNFPEYACSYLLHLSTESWPENTLSYSVRATQRKRDVAFWEKVYSQVPSFNIFDDHDVTDDWFIDDEWREKVLSSKEGAELISSALMSFLLFQSLNGYIDISVNTMRNLTDNLVSNNYSCSEKLKTLLGIQWSLTGTVGTPFIAFDTRTTRANVTKQPKVFQMYKININGYRVCPLPDMKKVLFIDDDIKKNVSKISTSKDTIFIYTATPVFGMPGFEKTLDNLPNYRVISNYVDRECFSRFPLSWSSIAKLIAENFSVKNVVIISGDVHYSFVAEAEFDVNGKIIHCTQITTSPVCNTANIQPLSGANNGCWVTEAIFFGQDGLVDFLPVIRQSSQTDLLFMKLKDRSGEFISRRWRIIGKGTTSLPRPLYETGFAEITLDNDNVKMSLRNDIDKELIGIVKKL